MMTPTANPIDSARFLTGGGLRVIPVEPRGKRPIGNAWQTLRLTEEDLPAYFTNGQNVGILLGEPSGWVVDVDLDSPEAVRLADEYLPPTHAVFGRAGSPRSHRLYQLTAPSPTRKWQTPATGMIVELRSTGTQTVAPGSVHPSGEAIVWQGPDGETLDMPGEPAKVDPHRLGVCLEALAAACGWQPEPAKAAAPLTAPPSAPSPLAGLTTPYGRAGLDAETAKVASAAEGGRNDTLNTAALKVGRLVAGGQVTREDACRELLEAARQCGLSEREARATIASGLAAGEKYPRVPEARPATPAVDISALVPPQPLPTPTPTLTDPGPLPLEALRVPGFVGEVMDHCLTTAPYPNHVLAFAGALSLQAFLAGRKVRDPGDNRTNLYILGLASSSAGKDWPRKLNAAILQHVGKINALGDKMASGEGLQDALVITPAMLYQTDEMDTLLQSMTHARDARYENLMGSLLTLYSSANSIFPMRRKATTKANQEPPGVINQPCLVMFGTAIPMHYYGALNERMLTNGFFARMLIIESDKRAKGQEPSVRPIPPRVLEAAKYWADLPCGPGNLGDVNPEPREVKHADDAKRLLIELREQADTEYGKAEEQRDECSMTVWGRVNEQVRKLSLIYAISENHKAPLIGTDAVTWATTLVMHQAKRMLYQAAAHAAATPFEEKALKAMRIIRESPDKRILHMNLLRRMKIEAKALKDVMETLTERGEVKTIMQEGSGRSGVTYEIA